MTRERCLLQNVLQIAHYNVQCNDIFSKREISRHMRLVSKTGIPEQEENFSVRYFQFLSMSYMMKINKYGKDRGKERHSPPPPYSLIVSSF